MNRHTHTAVLGAGSWGTALALLLAQNGEQVQLWARSNELAEAIRQHGENRRYLPGVTLPPQVQPTAHMGHALQQAHTVVFAVPSGAMRDVARQAEALLPHNALLLSAAKGLEEETGLRMSEVLSQTLPGALERLAALSGPNLAVEIAQGFPAAGVVAAVQQEVARSMQKLFSQQNTPVLRLYTSTDLVGVELGGAIKNQIAIAAGVCDGLGFGENAKAALMTRGLHEAVRLGVAMGGEAITFMGLSGAGDLIATAAGRLSRNYRVGYALGQGEPLCSILAELGQVAEGVPTTHVLCRLAKEHRVEMPLCSALYRLLFEGETANTVLRDLMLRPTRPEK